MYEEYRWKGMEALTDGNPEANSEERMTLCQKNF